MRKVKELISPRLHTKGEVGIEVEVEGRNLNHSNTNYWRREDDSSLKGRDNAEYVLHKPIAFKEAQGALQELTTHLRNSSMEPSIRTGVHVHINVQDYTLTEVATLSTLYLVVEDLLLEICGEGRQSNLFCLKGCEAEYMIREAVKFFRTENLDYVSTDAIRYSGLNLASIAKYGSVEFRSLRTPANLGDIGKWVSTLAHLAKMAREDYANPIEVLGGYSHFDADIFIERVLPEYADTLRAKSGWRDKLKRGMRSAQDLAFSQDWTGKKVIVGPSKDDEVFINLVAAHPTMDVDRLFDIYHSRAVAETREEDL